MPRASCTRRPGDTASRRRGRGTPIARTLLPAVRRPPSPGEEPRSSRLPHLPRCKRRWRSDAGGERTLGKKTKASQRSSTDRGAPRRRSGESGVAITVRWGAPRSQNPRAPSKDAQFLDAFMGCAPLVGDPAGKREAPAQGTNQT